VNKTFSGIEIKSATKGEVSAVFATFNVIDKDGDVILPSAIKSGTEVVISAYGHQSHQGALPVGKGVIRITESEAIVDGQFFLKTTAGRETFEVVKELGAIGEWSFSLHNVKSHRGQFDGMDVNFLESIFVKEVSPVLIGAGVNTRTVGVKSAASPEEENVVAFRGAIRPHDTATSLKAWKPEQLPDLAPVADLRAKHAWVDTTADPEASASYKFAHHDAKGAASVRACLLGIARLKAGSHGIPEADVEGVFAHLAGHLLDADMEPTDLKSAPTLHDQLLDALAGVVDVIDAAERVSSVRAAKGKQLSQVNSEVLVWMDEELRRLKALIDTPTETADREFLRFLRNQIEE
jgi:hypothetical protein